MAAHRYWRVYITAVQSSTVVACATLALRETIGGSNVASGGTAIASGGVGSTAPANAFDADITTIWQVTSMPAWIGYDFGSGVTKDIVEFAWTMLNSSTHPDQSPKDCQVEWSDDGSTWVALWPVVSIPVWAQGSTRAFSVPNISTTISATPASGTLLFVGGELEDFILSKQSSDIFAGTSGGYYRPTYSRGYVGMNPPNTNFIWANFTASTTFAVTTRCAGQVDSSWATTPFLTLGVGANARLRLRRTTAAQTSGLTLEKFDGTTATSLVVSTATYAATTIHKIDVLVDSYGATGRVRVFINNALFIDTGVMDITAGGATSLDRLSLIGFYASSFATYYSEVVVATEDTRPLSVLTLAPNGLGDLNSHASGGYADIDELTGSESDVAVLDTAGQMFSVHTTGVPSAATGFAVRGVKLMSAAARGSTGPSRLALGVRTNGTNAFAPSLSLDTGYSNNSITLTTNPVTGAAWTAAELELLQLAFKAET